MPSALIGALRATLGLDTAQFEASADKAKGKLGGLKSALMSTASSFAPMISGAALGTAAVTAFAYGMQQAAEAADFADDLAAQAYKLGVSAEYLQKFNHAAEASDVPAEAAVEALNGLSSAIGALQTRIGDGKIRKAMEALGISQEQIKSFKSVEDALPVLADKISQLGTITEQTQFAKKFGIEALLPLLKQGSAGIKDLMQNAEDLGFVMSEDVVNRLADMNEQLRIAEQRSKMAGFQLGAALTPALVELKNRAADAVNWLAQVLDQYNAIQNRATATLESRRSRAYEEMSKLIQDPLNGYKDGKFHGPIGAMNAPDYAKWKKIYEETNAELDRRREADRKAANERGAGPGAGSAAGGGGGNKKRQAVDPLDELRKGPDASWRSAELWTLTTVDPNRIGEAGPLRGLKAEIEEITSDGLLAGQLDAMARGREQMREGFQYAIEGAFWAARQGGVKGLIRYFSQELSRALFTSMAAKGAAFLEGKIFSSGGSGVWAGLKSLIGFDTGGSFTVGGVGGVDSQLRTLRLTPGEKVTVSRPNQGSATAGGVLYVQVDKSDLFDVHVRRLAASEAKSAGVQSVQAATSLTQEQQARRAAQRLR